MHVFIPTPAALHTCVPGMGPGESREKRSKTRRPCPQEGHHVGAGGGKP